MRFSWHLLLAAALPLAGCGDATRATASDAGASSDVALADGAPEDVPPARPCALGGTGRLRVSVALDPGLERREPEVWLSARCGEDDREVRLVRWDRSPAMVLDGFGPGAYTVFASSFLGAPSTSARTEIDAVSTASLSVTLSAEPGAIATLQAGGAGGAVDAGVAPRGDAGAGAADVAAVPSWSARTYITDPETSASLGSVEVEAVPAERADEDGGARVAVRVVVRNTCSLTGGAGCGTIALHGAEVRSLDGETPRGLGAGAFVTTTLSAGESASMVRPMVIRGALPDAQHALRVAVYGATPRAARTGMRP